MTTVARREPVSRELDLERETARLRGALTAILDLAAGDRTPGWTDTDRCEEIADLAEAALKGRQTGGWS